MLLTSNMERKRRPVLGILTFICYTLHIVNAEDVCRPQCQGLIGDQYSQYEAQTTYQYKFNSVVNITLPKTRDFSTVTVKATVLLTPQTECSYMLRLQHFAVTGANFQTYENIESIEKPVTFSYQNGAIGDSICTDSSDSQFSLNIKRGILSLFQTDTQQKYDMFGVCPTVVRTEGSPNGDQIITKIRNLNRCKSSRENIVVGALKNIIEANPILKGDFSMIQSSNGGLLRTVNVREHYTYLALGTNHAAEVFVKSALEFVGGSREAPTGFMPTVSKSITFEDPAFGTASKSTMQAVVDALKSLVSEELVVGENSARRFLNLVKIMRVSHKDDLIALYRYIRSALGMEARDVFISALLRCGTGASVSASIELARSKELSSSEAKLAYLSFANVIRATPDVLDAAASMLNSNELPRDAYMAVGNLVKSYCEENACNVGFINAIMTGFARKLVSTQESEVIYALKALTNARQPNEVTSRRILTLAYNGPMRIRAAALSALLQDSCREITRNGALHILSNAEEDSELRIRAYLILAQCPTYETAHAVERILNEDASYQVGSFITSHLKSCTNTFATIKVHKKFPQDPRRYSFNVGYNDVDTKTSSRASVVYSQAEFLPRFVNLNVSADMFGSDVNLLEVELRQENLDRLAEYYLGPKGVSPDHALSKRDVSDNEVEEFTKRIHANQTSDNIGFDLSVKLFGSDLLYWNVDGGNAPERAINNAFEPFKRSFGAKLPLGDIAETNAILLDSQLTFPTSLGFPLRLAVEAVSSVQVKMETKSGEYKLKWRFIPSANVEIVTSITVDAHVVESGLKVFSNIHAASGADLEIRRNPYLGDDVKLMFPVNQQQVSVSHDLVFTVREPGQADVAKPIQIYQNRETTSCFGQFEAYSGIKVCTKLNYPPPSQNKYLAGNYKMALTLNNTDFSHFEIYQRTTRNPSTGNTYELGAKIVGTKQTTKTGLTVTLGVGEELVAKADLVIPKINATIEGRLSNTKTEKSVSFAVIVNNIITNGKVGVAFAGTPHKRIYTPLLYYSEPTTFGQHYLLNTKGSVHVEHNSKHELKIKLENLQLILNERKIYSVHGDLGVDRHSYHGDLALSDGSTTIKLHEKLRNLKSKIKFGGFIKNNLYPHLNLHVDYEFVRLPASLESVLHVVHGSDAKSKYNRFTVKNVYNTKLDHYDLRSNHTISYPAVNFEAQVDYAATSNSTVGGFEFKHNATVYGAKLAAKYNQKERGDYDVNLSVYDENNKIEVGGKRDVHRSLNIFNNTLAINRALYEVSGRLEFDYSSYFALLIKAPELHSPLTVDFQLNRKNGDENWILLINDGRTKYVDFITTITRSSLYSKFKTYIPYVLTGEADFSHSNMGGNGEMTIDLDNGCRINTALNYGSDPKLYNLKLKLTYYSNFRRAPTRSISFATNTQIGSILNSVNTIEIDNSMYAQLTLKLLSQRSYEYQEEGLELELLMNRDGIATLKCKHIFIRTNEMERKIYTIDIQEEGLLDGNENTLNLKADNKRRFVREYADILTMSSNNAYIGRFNLNLTTATLLEDYKRTKYVMFKFFESNMHDGIYYSSTVNTVPETWNYIINATAFRGAEQVFFNGTYRNDADEGKVNITTEIHSTVFQDLKNAKLNFSVVVPKSNNRDDFRAKTDVIFILNEYQFSPYGFIVHADTRLGSQDGILTASYNDITARMLTSERMTTDSYNDETATMLLDYGFDRNRTANTFGTNFIIKMGNEQLITAMATFTVNSLPRHSQCLIKAGVQYRNYPIMLQINATELLVRDNFEVYVRLDVKHSKYTIKTLADLSFLEAPKINMVITYPDQVTDHILGEVNFKQHNIMKSNLKVNLNSIRFLLDGKFQIRLRNFDNFTIEIGADCPSLELSNFNATLDMKPLNYMHITGEYLTTAFREGGELTLGISNAEQSLVLASTNFTHHTLAGENTFSWFLVTKIRNDYPKQYGMEFAEGAFRHNNNRTFKLMMKDNSNDLYTKLWLKKGEIKLYSSFCNSPRPCFKVVASHHYNLSRAINITESLYMDLRYFGWHEIEIKEIFTQSDGVLNFTSDLIFNNRNKYGHALLMNRDSFELSVNTPQRVVALDGHVKSEWGKPKTMRLDFYANKLREPHHKSSLSGLHDCRGTRNVGKCTSELRFADPYLTKDLVLLFNINHNEQQIEQRLVVDIFNNEQDAIVMLYKSMASEEGQSVSLLHEIKSKGLNFHLTYNEVLSYQLVPKPAMNYYYNVKVQIKDIDYESGITTKFTPEETLIGVKLFNENIVKVNTRHLPTLIEANIDLYGLQPITARTEIKNLNLINITVSSKEHPGEMAQFTMKVFGGEIAHVKLERYHKVKPILIYNEWLSVTDGKLIYDLQYDEHNMENYILTPTKHAIDNTKWKIRNLIRYGRRELGRRTETLTEDIFVKLPDFSETMKYYRAQSDNLNKELDYEPGMRDILMNTNQIYNPIANLIEATAKSTFESAYYGIFLAVSYYEHFENVTQTILIDHFEEFLYGVTIDMNNWLGRHKHDLKKDGIAFFKALEDALNVVNLVKESALHYYKVFKESIVYVKLNEGVPAPESFIRNFRRLTNELKQLTNSQEIHRLIDLVTDYTEKKLRREAVDDDVAIQDLVKGLEEGLKLIYNSDDVEKSWMALYAIYRLAIAEIEPAMFLLEHNRINSDELTMLAQDEMDKIKFPVDFNGVFTQTHIFTFDGKHVSFRGDCNYLLVADIVDRNFSLAASYSGGLLNSITYKDRHDTITLHKDGLVANEDLSISKRNVDVFRHYEYVTISSKSGIEIRCDLELTCSVRISGYYHAHLRGLLGNANHEMYDDFTLPNGEIAISGEEYINSYKLQSQCADIRIQNASNYPQCTDLLQQPYFENCKGYVNSDEYRTACNEGMHMGISETERVIANAYVTQCNKHGRHIQVPNSLVKCTNYEKAVNESFEVDLPGNSADIVIVFEEINFMFYSELLSNLLEEIRRNLKAKEINDIRFHMIGYGADKRHSHHYTFNGKLTFSEPTYVRNLKPRTQQSDIKLYDLSNRELLTDAYREALLYPFRSNALKSIIIFNDKPCIARTLTRVQKSLPFIVDSHIAVYYLTEYTVPNFYYVYTMEQEKRTCANYFLNKNGMVFYVPYGNPIWFTVKVSQTITRKLTEEKQRLHCQCRMISAHTAQNVCETLYRQTHL